MASKKQVSKSKELAPRASTQVVTGNWRERAAKSINTSRAAVAMLPQMSGNFVSFRGGVISLGGNQLANPLPIVLLTHGYERAYYSKPYVPDVLATPDCYSFDNVVPHPKAQVPQNDNCARCHWNEFGSAANQKGKGCKEGARIVFLHGDHIGSPDQVAAAPLMQGRLSVLNAKTFRLYIENVFDAENRATWMTISLMTNVPDARSQYAVSFAPQFAVEDDVLEAISLRVDEAEKLLTLPYPDLQEAPPPAARGNAAPARRRKF